MEYQRQLREIAAAGGMTQEELARRLSVSFVTVNTWINGHTKPRTASLAAIEQLYGEIVGTKAISPEQIAAAVRSAEALSLDPSALVQDRERVDRLSLYLTYHTNSIEGSTMTLADTREVLFANRALANRTQVEQAEARNHQAALLWLLEQITQTGFRYSEELIRSVHLRLMNGIAHDAGRWRTHNARISGSRVVLANPAKIARLMSTLIGDIGSAKRGPRSIASLHARFEQIHPFSDGNGRVGRLIMLAMALRSSLPPPIVQRERKHAYYSYLEAAQLNDNIDPLTWFAAESMISVHQLLASDEKLSKNAQ